MRKMVIQYPDGKYHTVQANKFFGVLIDGKEEYVLEYDDLTDNIRNCFTLLDRQGITFVKRTLSQEDYAILSTEMRFMQKKSYDLNVLPGKINLCKESLRSIRSFNLSKKNEVTRKKVVIYVDVAVSNDSFPYYLDANTARMIGLSGGAGGYYHLTNNEVKTIKDKYDIQYRNVSLGFVFTEKSDNKINESVIVESTDSFFEQNLDDTSLNSKISSTVTSLPEKDSNGVDIFIVYEDTSLIKEEHPFYLTRYDASRCGLRTDREYYHLKKTELDVIKRYTNVHIKKKVLAILDQKGLDKLSKHVVIDIAEGLNEKEVAELERLFEKLADFEDYYSFFGIENLRGASREKILSSPRIIQLSILFKKGCECGDELAINFHQFLNNFKESLQNSKTFK